ESLDPELREVVCQVSQRIAELSPRLYRVAQLIHYTPKQIAEQTRLSLTSVRKYLDDLYCQLELKRMDTSALQRDVVVALAVILYQFMSSEIER
ncbi:MAG: hypothetical protein C0184_05355, partial [Chloroflexus aggregans]